MAVIAGLVVRTEASRKAISENETFPTFAGFDEALLSGVDAVDIATPAESHFDLVRRAIRHAHVLVEKPLALTSGEAWELAERARRCGHVLMVNHLYRFHPVVDELARRLPPGERPRAIRGRFLNPPHPGCESLSPNLEMLHFFDLIEHLLQAKPAAYFAKAAGSANQVSVRYEDGMTAVVELGWRKGPRVRTLEFHFTGRRILADFEDAAVTTTANGCRQTFLADQKERPLERAVRTFLDAMAGRDVAYPDASAGAAAVDIALRGMPGPRRRRPTAAVIGGGIFGAACALELAHHCDVVLAERHRELLTEASFNNQFRHHSGFHYPRSLDTVEEVKATRAEFDAEFGEAIVRNGNSWYCTAAGATEITCERYLAFCRESGLNFWIMDPPEGLIDLERVSLALRTDELILDIGRLRALARARLAAHPAIDLRCGTEVAAGEIAPDGTKVFDMRAAGKTRREAFDYVVNATYANSNLLSQWFGFPVAPLRFDVCELLLLEIPMPMVSITILDAPFVSLMSTGKKNEFLLYQVATGVLQSYTTANGLPPAWEPFQSNHVNMLRRSREYFPVLDSARYIESRFGVRAVLADSEAYDSRATIVTDHGFGCWSVLGGKIGTCVSNARQITRRIFAEPAASRILRAAGAGSDTGG